MSIYDDLINTVTNTFVGPFKMPKLYFPLSENIVPGDLVEVKSLWSVRLFPKEKPASLCTLICVDDSIMTVFEDGKVQNYALISVSVKKVS